MSDPKAEARAIFDAAVAAVDPAECVRRALSGRSFPGRVTVVGAGKAAVPMAQAVESLVPGARGAVVTKYGHGGFLERVTVHEAAHPVPDEAGESATREILGLLDDGPTLCLISGGGSALLTAPLGWITLEDKKGVTDLLLKSGAAITELNCVRKHLSAVKGGRLARAAKGKVTSLILSDVIGDPLDAIASGPTAPDPTTLADARKILRDRKLWNRVPEPVRRLLEEGEETPKPGDPIFGRVENVIVGSNRIAVEAAADEARRLGYETKVLTCELQGEAREAAKKLVGEAKREKGKVCLLAGGETTVTVRGPGKGGRCQEFALAAAMELSGGKGITLLAAGTDGTDGPTDAAGAVVDGETLKGVDAQLEAGRCLKANDSHAFFARAGGHVVTGPTRTNVMDVIAVLVDR